MASKLSGLVTFGAQTVGGSMLRVASHGSSEHALVAHITILHNAFSSWHFYPFMAYLPFMANSPFFRAYAVSTLHCPMNRRKRMGPKCPLHIVAFLLPLFLPAFIVAFAILAFSSHLSLHLQIIHCIRAAFSSPTHCLPSPHRTTQYTHLDRAT